MTAKAKTCIEAVYKTIRVGFPLTLALNLVACGEARVRDDAASASEKSSAAHEVVEESAMVPPEETIKRAERNTKIAKANTAANAEYHFGMAQAYVAEGNTDRAIEEYKLTLMFDPNSAVVYARLSSEYVKKGMVAAAMESCKEALQRDPNYTDARLMLAGLYSTARETDLSIAEYDKVIKREPNHEEAQIYKAQVLVEAGRGEEAVGQLRKFAKKNSESAVIWYYLGRAEQRQEHYKQSTAAFKKAMELRPGFTQAGLSLGFMLEELAPAREYAVAMESGAKKEEKNGKKPSKRESLVLDGETKEPFEDSPSKCPVKNCMKEAIAVYKTLYEDTQDPAAANRLATIYLKAENYKEAVPYLESLKAADPDDLNVRVKLGLVQMELKNYDGAISTFKEILTKSPDSDRIHYYLGSIYEEQKKTDESIAELKQIKPDSKLYGDSVLHVASLYKQLNRVPEGKAFIAEAIKKSPRIANFYIFQASLEEETKNITAAVGILEKAVEIFPEDEKTRYYLGSLYDKQGQTDKSIGQMEAILKLNGENVDALNYIGYTWAVQGVRLADAEKMLRKAMSLRPHNGYITDSWGWYLFVSGKLKEAVVELETAVHLSPAEPTIVEHLGDAYLRADLSEKAVQQYQTAARLTEEAEPRAKIEAKLENLRRELARAGRKVPPSYAQPTTQPSRDRVPAGQ